MPDARPATWHRDLAMINYLFFFELVDSFLVPVAATTIFMGLPEFLNNPSSLAITIVVKIPTVSTFFMSFVLMRALANGPLELCRAAHIVKYKMLMLFSGKSPRTHARLSMPSAFQYAEHIPSHGLIFLLGRDTSQVWRRAHPPEMLSHVSMLTCQSRTTPPLPLRIGQFYSSIAPLMAVTAALHCALFARIFAYKFVHVYDRHTFQLGGRIAQKLLYLRWLALYMSEALFVASIIIRTCSKVDPSSIVQMVITLVVPVATIVLHVIIRRRTYPRLLRPLAADDEASVYSSPPSEASIASASDYQTVRTSPSSMGSRSSTPLIAEHDRSATAAISCSQAMADWAGRQSPLAVDNGASGAPSEKSARSVSADSHDPAAQAAQAIWPAAMSDPGYSLVWLPLLPATCSTRLVDIGAILAQTDATHDARPSPDAPAGEPTWVDARAFMDHLYEAISRWLGQYGRVETAHAELHKRRIRTTTLLPPRVPVAALRLHSPLN
ncbi:phosphate metabolism protein 7 [Coemansia spiralis]|nr:phosphate metabolism protein 7 [Coemansia spiralis]